MNMCSRNDHDETSCIHMDDINRVSYYSAFPAITIALVELMFDGPTTRTFTIFLKEVNHTYGSIYFGS